MVSKNAADKLKRAVATYSSTFNFDEWGVDDATRKIVSENEAIARREFKREAEAIYKSCRAIYEISLVLKKEGVFKAWYDHVGMGKDFVAERISRYELFMHFPDKCEFIARLPIKSVLALTSKRIELEQMYDIVEAEISDVKTIKELLTVENKMPLVASEEVEEALVVETAIESSSKVIENEFFKKINSVGKVKESIKNTTDINSLKEQMKMLSAIKKQTMELEKFVQERMETLSQDQNMRMFNE